MGIWLTAWGEGEEQTAGIVVLSIGILIVAGGHWLVSRARLELSPAGIRLRQIGMSMEVPWTEVSGLRLERGREGLVTRSPIAGRGAANLSAVRGIGIGGAAFYSVGQRTLIAERRWIPIEAFAWHLRHGDLAHSLTRFAPGLETIEPTDAAAGAERTKPATWVLIGVIVAACLALGVGTHHLSDAWSDRLTAIVFAVVAPLVALRGGASAVIAFRARSWFLGVVFSALALFGAAWCLIAWSDLVRALSGPA